MDRKEKKEYYFGKLVKFNLDEIESEILIESVYLDVYTGSDPSFKEEVKEMTPVLHDLMKIRPVQYQYRTDEFRDYDFPEGEQHGLMADQIEELYPHLVRRDKNGKRFINYGLLTPILLKSIQEISSKVERQEKVIEKLIDKLNISEIN